MPNRIRPQLLVLTPLLLLATSPFAAGQTLLSVEPAYGDPADEVAITITCDFEHPFAEPIFIYFSPASEITHGIVNLTDTDKLQTIIYIPEGTACGVQDLTVESAMWTYTGNNLFEVCGSAGDPRIVSVNPDSALAGDTLSVTIVGANTHFQEGSSQVSFPGGGINVSGVTVTDPVVLTAQLDISAAATPGVREVTIRIGPVHHR
jgi:hypothetical protein